MAFDHLALAAASEPAPALGVVFDPAFLADVPLSPTSGILFRSKKVATSVLTLPPDEVVTGDPAFDAAVFLTGTNEAVVLAAADAGTRAELLAAADSLAAAGIGRIRALPPRVLPAT